VAAPPISLLDAKCTPRSFLPGKSFQLPSSTPCPSNLTQPQHLTRITPSTPLNPKHNPFSSTLPRFAFASCPPLILSVGIPLCTYTLPIVGPLDYLLGSCGWGAGTLAASLLPGAPLSACYHSHPVRACKQACPLVRHPRQPTCVDLGIQTRVWHQSCKIRKKLR